MALKCAFFGTPLFALEALRAVEAANDLDLLAVITQADKPSGRGMKLTPPPLKTFAEEKEIPVFQPNSLRKAEDTEELWEFLKQTGPYDAFICVAYGKVIPEELLYFPALGTINIHPSLLPRWRGAAPIQRALFEGDKLTGVSIMQLELGLDTGPVFAQEQLAISPEDTAGTLHDSLSEMGAKMLISSLVEINLGNLKATPQAEEGITYAEKWEKEDLQINWNEPAERCNRRIRASAPTPGARCHFNEVLIKIHAAEVVEQANFAESAAGSIVEVNREELIVACGENSFLSLRELQWPGKAKLAVQDVLQGRSFKLGELFS